MSFRAENWCHLLSKQAASDGAYTAAPPVPDL